MIDALETKTERCFIVVQQQQQLSIEILVSLSTRTNLSIRYYHHRRRVIQNKRQEGGLGTYFAVY